MSNVFIRLYHDYCIFNGDDRNFLFQRKTFSLISLQENSIVKRQVVSCYTNVCMSCVIRLCLNIPRIYGYTYLVILISNHSMKNYMTFVQVDAYKDFNVNLISMDSDRITQR